MARKRKTPITATPSSASHTPKATRTLIREFHVLRKREAILKARNDLEELEAVQKQMDRMGGLQMYQEMSSIGQGNDRGGGTEKVLIEWLPEALPPHLGKGKGKEKVQLLEVGALKPDNFSRCSSWISATPMDLRSRHPLIKEQDFLLMDSKANSSQWDVISLSLVLNFVPDAHDRGKMLRLARQFLRSTGVMFLVLPSPCVQNSRYLDQARLSDILRAAGFAIEKYRLKPGGKLAYFLCGAVDIPTRNEVSAELTSRRTLRKGNRNNFAILL